MAFSAGASDEVQTDTSARQDNYQLRIGVRSKAMPFSFQAETMVDVLTAATPGPLSTQRYTGYITRICDSVLIEMMLDADGPVGLARDGVQIVDLDKEIAKLDKQPSEGRFGLLKGYEVEIEAEGDDSATQVVRTETVAPTIDILCDPATITNARRTGLIISPPVYLTGVSYLTQPGISRQIGGIDDGSCPQIPPDNPKAAKFLFGLVGNTSSARSGIRALLATNEMPQYRDALIAFLRGESNCDLSAQQRQAISILQNNLNGEISGSVMMFRSHEQAAEAFCNGQIGNYIGDREIILANVSNIPGCDFTNGNRTFTTDRYAIFGRLDYGDDPERALRVARFFEILSQKIVSHPSIIDQAFYDTFHPTSPTPTLDMFFRSVRGAP
ncbi:hypothetical protein RD1_3708 [Roseobacter denitrificans OCh 114]|uniref:Uncharacterized protein n=2 Tax=Roseobacter denitrificans TaxID=2434 RepID=Q162B3_ROSDO|nr:hypothetical protein RD1_3708 [Roseobacter denitrificans OCh 114]